jgi:hypothetical protein
MTPTRAGAVDPSDLGVANGLGTTMMNIGMLTGIQAMFTVLGDGRSRMTSPGRSPSAERLPLSESSVD